MKIGRVLIKNFRSISSTEFEITGGKIALVGGNESGKSNVLLAIQKFLNHEKFTPEDNYQLSADDMVIEVDFLNFTDDEAAELSNLLGKQTITILTVRRTGEKYEVVSPTITPKPLPVAPVISPEANTDNPSPETPSEETKENDDQKYEKVISKMPKAVVIKTVNGLLRGKNIPVSELFPEQGTEAEPATLTKSELKTIHDFLGLGGITQDDITDSDTGKSFHDLNKKASIIAQKLSKSWKQERIEIRMSADGTNLVFEFKDCGNIPDGIDGQDPSKWIWTYPEDRSYGFRWFVTFYSSYLYGIEQSKNVVFLIDEAGGALNKRAQVDLLDEFDKLTSEETNNQIIYATHSKYMVKWDFRNNVYAVFKNKGLGTNVNGKWWSKYKIDLLPPPLDELDVTWSNELLGKDNLIVEGPVDLEVLRVLKTIFQDSGIPEDPFIQFKLIPGMGRFDSMIELGKACAFHKKKSLLLFDSDTEGLSGKTEATASGLKAEDISTLCATPELKIMSIEDLLPRKILLKYVNESGKEMFEDVWEDISHLQQVEALGTIGALKKRLIDSLGISEEKAGVFLRDRKYQIIMKVLKNITSEDFLSSQVQAITNLFKNLNIKLIALPKPV